MSKVKLSEAGTDPCRLSLPKIINIGSFLQILEEYLGNILKTVYYYYTAGIQYPSRPMHVLNALLYL